MEKEKVLDSWEVAVELENVSELCGKRKGAGKEKIVDSRPDVWYQQHVHCLDRCLLYQSIQIIGDGIPNFRKWLSNWNPNDGDVKNLQN